MFVAVIMLIGFISGIIYFNLLSNDIKNDIAYTISNYNNLRYNSIFKDLIIMSVLIVTSFFIIGVPLSIFYLYYESLSIGLITTIFVSNYNFYGLVYIKVSF